jgi:phosphohistidine phosphatase
MKKLYLVRHAKSDWQQAEALHDSQRPLNKRGLRDAPIIAQRLYLRFFELSAVLPDAFISSPAQRALQTARIFAEAFSLPADRLIIEKSLYEGHAGENNILSIIRTLPTDYNSVFLFGHNPAFTDFANFYAPTPLGNLPTCGVFGLNFDISSWAEAGTNNAEWLFIDYPKNNDI